MRRSRTRGRSRVAPSSSLAGIHGVLVVVFYGLSFFSGVAALVYEITWARMLSLAIGSTTIAASVVIAGFMGGMGVGARWFHLLSRRGHRPLKLYAFLEIGIAVSTALLTLSFYALPGLFAGVSSALPAGPWPTIVKLGAVLVLLFVPAALMGATFPALCTVMIRTVRGVDRHLGMIYGINTIGAAAGALLAGLVLIERLGLTATVHVANAINLAVACTAFLLLRTPVVRATEHDMDATETAILTHVPRRLTGLVLFVSGLTTLGYEILWFRTLRYSVGNSTYALTTVLVIFLVGLGLGSLLLRPLARRRTPERDLALCQCAIGVLAMVAMTGQWMLLSSGWMRDTISIFSDAVMARPWWLRLLADGAMATFTMLPATLFMGLSFPLASRLFLGDVRQVSARTGGAYLLANLGSVCGAIAAVVLLLPFCGTIGGTKVLAALNVALALVLAVAMRRRIGLIFSRVFAAAAVVAVAAVALPSAPALEGELTYGVRGEVVYFEEGDLATVQVLEIPDEPDKRAMSIDGYQIGWSAGFRGTTFFRKQVLLAHLPMLLEPRIQSTLNIGLASAATLQALASHARVTLLDCVEISTAVVRACRFFPASEVLRDPRVNVIVDDAVHYLLMSDKRYDLIVSDGKQHPFFAGNAVLLSAEFYRSCHDRLSEDGLFIQWIPTGMLAFDFQVVLRTMCDVFPHVEVFYFPLDSAFMIGSRRPLGGRALPTEEAFRASPAREDLAPYFLDRLDLLWSRRVAGRGQLRRVLGDGPRSTWDHLLLDYSTFKAARSEFQRAQAENLRLLLRAESAAPAPGEVAFEAPQSAFTRSAALMRSACAEYFAGKGAGALAQARQAVEVNPDDGTARAFLAMLMKRQREYELRGR